MEAYKVPEKIGWVATLSLDRLAMKYFDIPDIRMLWAKERKFKNMNKQSDILGKNLYEFEFGLRPGQKPFQENDFLDIIRNVGGNSIKKVEEIQKPGQNKTVERGFKIYYSGVEKDLEPQEVEKNAKTIIGQLKKVLKIKITEAGFSK